MAETKGSEVPIEVPREYLELLETLTQRLRAVREELLAEFADHPIEPVELRALVDRAFRRIPNFPS